tara:strand:+ start:48594 stop:49322 length:729 start_codon:yes stop_codon:yes gene_type:complete
MPISFERGYTSKNRLRVDWLHPVPPERDRKTTSASGRLPVQEALDLLWAEDDGRPLLVLRECTNCKGSDGALLSRSLANDKTVLMTKWFRTVRLPAHITDHSHPFHNVFADLPFKKRWPHVFLLADRDSKPVDFTGLQTQSKLWQGMFRVLNARYAKNPKKAIRNWLRVLDRFDVIDARTVTLKAELLQERATNGPTTKRAKKMEAQLAELDAQRKQALADEAKVRDLALLKLPSRVAAAGK